MAVDETAEVCAQIQREAMMRRSAVPRHSCEASGTLSTLMRMASRTRS